MSIEKQLEEMKKNFEALQKAYDKSVDVKDKDKEKSKALATRIPIDLADDFNTLCEADGKNCSQTLKSLIESYVNGDLDISNNSLSNSDLDRISDRIALIIPGSIAQVPGTKSEVDRLKSQVDQLKSEVDQLNSEVDQLTETAGDLFKESEDVKNRYAEYILNDICEACSDIDRDKFYDSEGNLNSDVIENITSMNADDLKKFMEDRTNEGFLSSSFDTEKIESDLLSPNE